MFAPRQEDTSPPRRVPFEGGPPGTILIDYVWMGAPGKVYVHFTEAYFAGLNGGTRFENVTAGETGIAGTGVDVDGYTTSFNVTAFLWAPGDTWQLVSPGWAGVVFPQTGLLDTNNIQSVTRIDATHVDVEMRFAIDASFVPGAMLHDDTDDALTSGPAEQITVNTFRLTVPAGTFDPGNGWSVNAGVWGGNPANTGIVA
jgi:hypothetical protein